jgi:hypothetical protein
MNSQKVEKPSFFVIPAKAGIQSNQLVLDPSACPGHYLFGVRRGDGLGDFLRSRQDSVPGPCPVLHILLGIDAIAMPVQRDTIMHAPVGYRGWLEKPASPLIGYQRAGSASGHESDNAAVGAAAFFVRLAVTVNKRTIAAVFMGVHG